MEPKDVSNELWREYDFLDGRGGHRVYRVKNPTKLYVGVHDAPRRVRREHRPLCPGTRPLRLRAAVVADRPPQASGVLMATAISILKIIALVVTILSPLLSRRVRTGLTGWVRR